MKNYELTTDGYSKEIDIYVWCDSQKELDEIRTLLKTAAQLEVLRELTYSGFWNWIAGDSWYLYRLRLNRAKFTDDTQRIVDVLYAWKNK